MNSLSDSFGRLSTSAEEWQPTNSTGVDSELTATGVKEFVPGQGWINSGGGPPSSSSSSTPKVSSDNPYLPNPSTTTATSDEDESALHNDGRAYPSTIPAGPSPPPFRSLHSLGLSDDLWRQHRQWAMEGIRQMEPNDPRHKAVPAPYTRAFVLDYHPSSNNDPSSSSSSPPRNSFGYPCTTFQVVSREDGHLYCLRRFDSVKSVNPKIAAAVLDQWSGMEHPGLVTLHRCFVAQRAVFFVHQYIPGAASLKGRFGAGGLLVNEPLLWSAICQWTSVLRRVHQAHLAVRTLDWNHVLVQVDAMRLRFWINAVGVADALEWEARKPLEALQQQDVRQLGRLILSLATGREITATTDAATLANCEGYFLQSYSRELHNLAMTLIRSPTAPSIVDVSRALAGRVWDEWDHTSLSLQRTERALGAEYESGRILRLLLKLGFVNERPEFGPNRRWAQSGDSYVLTLFRDYVFHQADGAGNPVMDMGHVITTLNKLDAADDEQIVLSSRDGKSVMVVSFADVARCLDSAYHELCAGSVVLPRPASGMMPPY